MLDFFIPVVVGLHIASAHPGSDLPVNNVNPGVFAVNSDNWVAGAYFNSLRRPTVYGGKRLTTGPFSLTLGLATGYDKAAGPCRFGLHDLPGNPCMHGEGGAVIPFASPSIAWHGHRLSFLPGALAGRSNVFHYSYEWSF